MYVYALQHLAVYIIYVLYKQLALEGIPQWLKHWTGNTKFLRCCFKSPAANSFLRSDIGWASFVLLCASQELCFLNSFVLFWSGSFIAATTPVATSSSECVKWHLPLVTSDLFYFHSSQSCTELIAIRIIIFCSWKSDCERGLLPRCSLQAGEKDKGKQSHKNYLAKEEGNGLSPPTPLNSHQCQYKSRRVSEFIPVPWGPWRETGLPDWCQEPSLTYKISIQAVI